VSWYFVPDDWKMSEELLAWTKDMGLTDKTIEKELESFRDHQYKKPMMRADACWRNWVKNGIDWDRIKPVQETRHNMPQEESTEEKKRAMLQYAEQIKRFGK
jgi:hypothetical protein